MGSPYGRPEVLLSGGRSNLDAYKDPVWQEYTKKIMQFRKTRGGGYIVWTA